MKRYSCLLGLVLLAASQMAYANGMKTYMAVCTACHTAGVAGAPKLGDKQKWAPLIAEGQVIITAHGYVGVRDMPARGGKPDLTVAEFADALNYMVNQSGGDWKKPDAATMNKINAEIVRRQKEMNAGK